MLWQQMIIYQSFQILTVSTFSHIAEFYLLESLHYINTLLCIFVIVSADINVLIYVGIKVLCFRRFKLIINANSQKFAEF